MTVWHDDYLLFVWKWVIIKVFTLIVFTLSRLRRRGRRGGGIAVSGVEEVGEVEGATGEERTLRITL